MQAPGNLAAVGEKERLRAERGLPSSEEALRMDPHVPGQDLLQAKLLRVLESGEFKPVHGDPFHVASAVIGVAFHARAYSTASDLNALAASNQLRSHWYALDDQKNTKRMQVVKQPGACANCHAAEAPQLIAAMGWEAFNKTPYNDLKDKLHYGTSCADCHDPQTMSLRITRPALLNALKARNIDTFNRKVQRHKNVQPLPRLFFDWLVEVAPTRKAPFDDLGDRPGVVHCLLRFQLPTGSNIIRLMRLTSQRGPRRIENAISQFCQPATTTGVPR